MKTSTVVLTSAFVVGAGLLVLPWLPKTQRMPVPATFGADDDAYRELTNVAADVDVVCREGHLAELKQRITTSFLKDIEERLRQAGKGLSGITLKDQYLVGSLPAHELIAAGAESDRAALVYRRDRYDREGGRFLASVVFAWNGRRWLLHHTGFRRVQDRVTPLPALATREGATPAAAAASKAAQVGAAVLSEARLYLRQLLSETL